MIPLIEKFIINEVNALNGREQTLYLKVLAGEGKNIAESEWTESKLAATTFTTYPGAAQIVNLVATPGSVYQIEKIFCKE